MDEEAGWEPGFDISDGGKVATDLLQLVLGRGWGDTEGGHENGKERVAGGGDSFFAPVEEVGWWEVGDDGLDLATDFVDGVG